MKNLLHLTILLTALAILSTVKSQAQCTWQTILTDGFEYQTVCPDLIPGTVIHDIPQSYAVHSGTYSLYLNFINCVGTTGTCAGDTVYVRTITGCRNMSVRFSAWLTTSFSGLQSDVRIVITDGNNVVLNNQPSVLAPYAPNWIQYNSGTVTPATDDVKFIMITNVGGGNGNDLSMDDFLMEQCYPSDTIKTTSGNICDNLVQYDLINFLPANADTTGTWSGPSVLTGGSLGTFTIPFCANGNYVYHSAYYGTNPGCPLTIDTVAVGVAYAPVPYLGVDTIICSSASLLLNPGSFPGANYLWNTGSNAQTLLASTIFINGDTNIYTIKITDLNGCTGTDTLQIIFFNCSGLDENGSNSFVQTSPNPARDFIHINSQNNFIKKINILDNTGRIVKAMSSFHSGKIPLNDLSPGIYSIEVISGNKKVTRKFLKI